MTKNVQAGVITDGLQFLIPKEAETMLLPEISSSPFDDPDGFKADLNRQNWFWAKLLGEHPAAVQYSNGRITTILSRDAIGYRLSTFVDTPTAKARGIFEKSDCLRNPYSQRACQQPSAQSLKAEVLVTFLCNVARSLMSTLTSVFSLVRYSPRFTRLPEKVSGMIRCGAQMHHLLI